MPWEVQRGGRLGWCSSWRHPQEPARAATCPWTHSTPVPLVSLSLSSLPPSLPPSVCQNRRSHGRGGAWAPQDCVPTSFMRSDFPGTCSLSRELSP